MPDSPSGDAVADARTWPEYRKVLDQIIGMMAHGGRYPNGTTGMLDDLDALVTAAQAEARRAAMEKTVDAIYGLAFAANGELMTRNEIMFIASARAAVPAPEDER